MGEHYIDWRKVRLLRNGLWAEIREAYAQYGVDSLMLTHKMAAEQEAVNQNNYFEDEIMVAIKDWAHDKTRFVSHDVKVMLQREYGEIMGLTQVAAKLKGALLSPMYTLRPDKSRRTGLNGKGESKRGVWINNEHPLEMSAKRGGREKIPYLGIMGGPVSEEGSEGIAG